MSSNLYRTSNSAQYPLNGDHEALVSLNQQLAEVWSSIVRDVGDRVQCEVDPIELAINWHEVNTRLLHGLRCMAFSRYLCWFGHGRYLDVEARKQRAEVEEGGYRKHSGRGRG